MKTETQIKDRLKQNYIPKWQGCDASVSCAMKEFRERWAPYSASSKRYHIFRLIQEVLDPALVTYMETLPGYYKGFLPGSGTGVGFSEIIRLLGFEPMNRVQRQLLRQFIKTKNKDTPTDECFIATIESLIEVVWRCACKRPKKSFVTKGVNLNAQRKHHFCEFCGNLTEFAAFMDKVIKRQINDAELEDNKKLELSHKYCIGHKPQLIKSEWNPAYKQAKRSLTQFNIELRRLSLQCAKPSIYNAQSGDELIDSYFFQYMLGQNLDLTNQAELRDLARLMVDSKLSDNKKIMLVLQQCGKNKYEIAQKLLNKKQQPITRQAVSKTLAAVRKPFLLPD